MKRLKYIGSYLKVTAEGFSFVRHQPVEVPEAVAEKLLAATIANQPVFALVEEEPVVADA